MKSAPFLIVSLYLILITIFNYKEYINANYFILLFIYFLIIVITGLILSTKFFKVLIKQSITIGIKYEYFFLALSIIFTFLMIFLKCFFNKDLEYSKIILLSYSSYFLCAFAISNYNCFMYINSIRKKS